MKRKKMLIGIDDATRCPVIGSLYLAAVAVDPRQRIKYKSLPIRDSKKLTYAQIEKVYRMTNKDIWYRVYELPPVLIDEAYTKEGWNLNDECMFGTLRLLNQIPEFWEHSIAIDNCEYDRDKFIWRMNKIMERYSSNLFTELDKLNVDKWKIEHGADGKYWACSLASIYAKYHSIQEYKEIREVYGDFGSGNPGDEKTIQFIIDNPENPHIRKSWITYRRLVEKGKIGGCDKWNRMKKKMNSKV